MASNNNNNNNNNNNINTTLPIRMVTPISEETVDVTGMQLDIDSLTDLCAKVQKQNTTTTQTTSNQMKRKRKRKRKQYTDNKNPATCEYKDEGDDVQDYSSSGLKYNNNTTKIWRLSGEDVVDIVEFKKGRGMIHATVATNMLNSPDANLAAHDHGELLGGILGNGLKPMVQTNKTSNNPMENVWALPYGRWMSCVFHVLSTHGKALKEAGGYVALIMIPEDDPRMDLFTKFGAGGIWAQTCHPAYSMGFYVCPDDVFVVNIHDLPACLKQTQVHSDMVKLKTDAEKKATRAAYQASDNGKATRAAYQASDNGKAVKAAYLASDNGKATRAAYFASDRGKAVKAAYQASDNGKATRAAYQASDNGKAVKAAYLASDNGKATRAAYFASDRGKAVLAAHKAAEAAYEASDRGKATRAAYEKTRLEKNRAESALKRAATKLECVYCNARYYSQRGINDHQKRCTKK